MINPINLIPPQYKLLALGIALAVAFAAGGRLAWSWQANKYESQINKMVAEAQMARADAESAARQKEKENAKHNDEIERQLLVAQDKVRKLGADNRRLAAATGGLRDPGTTPADCVPGTQEAPTGPAEEAPRGSRVLSTGLQEYILRTVERAEAVTEYAWKCYQWAEGP